MARVPVAAGNLVERGPVSGATFQAADMGAGGRMIGQAVERFGGAISQYGDDVDKANEILDVAAAKKLDVEYSDWSRKRLYTDDGAFYTQEGFAAANARPGLESEIEKQREALLGKATTPRMRAMAEEAIRRRSTADLEGIARHATSQYRVEEKRASAARTIAAGDDAVTYSNEPKRFAQELTVGLMEITTEASKSGASPETIKHLETQFTDGVYSRVAKGKLQRGDIEGAQAWVEAHRDRLSPDTEADLDGALYAPILERRADGIVDDLLGVAAPVEAQGAQAKAVGVVAPRMVAITAHAESRNRDRDAAGNIITSSAGAQGRMQVMPGTNLDPGFGIKPAKDGSDEERARVGREYLAAMMKRYGNDPAKAWAAYNWGPGNVDKAIGARGGQWMDAAPAETRAYVRGNMAALGGRGAQAEQQAPREHDLTTLLAAVDGMNLPFDVEKTVRRQLQERVGTDERLLARQRDAASEQAWELVDKGKFTRESQIPKELWDTMGVGDRRSIRSALAQNAEGTAPKTDYGTYTHLSTLYASDPAAFAKLNPATFYGKLSPSDYETVLGWQRAAIKDAKTNGRGEGQVTHSRISGIVKNATESIGLTTTGISTRSQSTRDARAQVSARIYKLETSVARDVQLWQRANPGKQITDLEIAAITDRQLIRWAPSGASIDDPKTTRFAFERNGQGGSFAVPTKDYRRLKQRGRAILGYEPTDAQVTAAYLSEARGGQ